jgi:hypothetical protein
LKILGQNNGEGTIQRVETLLGKRQIAGRKILGKRKFTSRENTGEETIHIAFHRI